MSSNLLNVQDLHIRFYGKRQREVEAVKGISFALKKGKTLAIVGESGSGKSATALALTRLLPSEPTCKITGKIDYRGKDLLTISSRAIRAIRGKEIAYIFQEPSTSLNPVFTIGYQIAESIRLHIPEAKNLHSLTTKALERVGIDLPAIRKRSYPHELSGGMQQRAMIAMALACEPKILIADEPTTALDVTVQKQIIDLLKELQKKLCMSVILITHNFGIVSGFAEEVLVMFRGRIVERGPTSQILQNPKHPYSQALINCIPKLGEKKTRLTTIDYDYTH